jgi:hypothetical protein
MDCPKYAALSYTWGDQSEKRTIFFPRSQDVNDERYHHLKVGENLFQALRQAPYVEDGVEWMWIDAICINQSDLEEKGDQVAKMYDIYKQSKYVMAWLGPAANNSNTFIEWLNAEITEAYNHRDDPDFDEQNWKLAHPFYLSEELEHFFDRPYWSRAWVRQG